MFRRQLLEIRNILAEPAEEAVHFSQALVLELPEIPTYYMRLIYCNSGAYKHTSTVHGHGSP